MTVRDDLHKLHETIHGPDKPRITLTGVEDVKVGDSVTGYVTTGEYLVNAKVYTIERGYLTVIDAENVYHLMHASEVRDATPQKPKPKREPVTITLE